MRPIWLTSVLGVVATLVLALLPTVAPVEAAVTNIVVLGGPSAVSGSVLSELATCTSGSVSRIAGANRYATAAAVSSTFLNPGVDLAYVATGDNFPDALAGSAAAGAGTGGPVLLVRPTSIPSETATELNRLNPNTIVVLGGTAAISAGVELALGAYGTVVRVAGANRYSTGALVSSYAFPAGADTAYVATGTNFPDALAGGPAAVRSQGPVLLIDPDRIPSSVGTELARLNLSYIKVLGGTAAVSTSVEAGLKAYAPSVTRLSGLNRYATAAAVSKNTFAPGVGTIFIATGTNFPDALAGGPVAGMLGGPILLTELNSIPGDTRNEIERLTGQLCSPPPPTTTTAAPADGNLAMQELGWEGDWSGAIGSDAVYLARGRNGALWSGTVGSDAVSLAKDIAGEIWRGSIGGDSIDLVVTPRTNLANPAKVTGWIGVDSVTIGQNVYGTGWSGSIGGVYFFLSTNGVSMSGTGVPREIAAIVPMLDRY